MKAYLCNLAWGVGGFDPHEMLFIAGWPLAFLLVLVFLVRRQSAEPLAWRKDFHEDGFVVPDELPS